MSNIDKFITSNLVKELDNKAAEVASGGQVAQRAIITSPDGTVTETEPGDMAILTPDGQLQITTFPLNPFLGNV